MKKWLILGVVLLIFGCIGGNSTTPQQEEETKIYYTVEKVTVLENITHSVSSDFSHVEEEEQSENVSAFTYDPNAPITVFFFPPKNGEKREAVLIRKGDFHVLMGAGIKSDELIQYLQHYHVDDLEYVIVPVADRRYYDGLFDLIKYMGVGTVVVPPNPDHDVLFEHLLEVLKDKNISVRQWKPFSQHDLDGITFTVLNPQISSQRFKDNHNDGYVLKIKDRGFTMLNLGGIEDGALNFLIANYGNNLSAQVIKMPNFGYAAHTNNVAEMLFEKAKPVYAVITGGYAIEGGSNYLDPRKILEKKAELKHVKVLETFDAQKSKNYVVVIESNGQDLITHVETPTVN
jgi:hypothetical protein